MGKRAADKQLIKDGEDDDRDAAEPSGTREASAEEMARRKVKPLPSRARASGSGSPGPSAFSGFSFTAPPAASAPASAAPKPAFAGFSFGAPAAAAPPPPTFAFGAPSVPATNGTAADDADDAETQRLIARRGLNIVSLVSALDTLRSRITADELVDLRPALAQLSSRYAEEYAKTEAPAAAAVKVTPAAPAFAFTAPSAPPTPAAPAPPKASTTALTFGGKALPKPSSSPSSATSTGGFVPKPTTGASSDSPFKFNAPAPPSAPPATLAPPSAVAPAPDRSRSKSPSPGLPTGPILPRHVAAAPTNPSPLRYGMTNESSPASSEKALPSVVAAPAPAPRAKSPPATPKSPPTRQSARLRSKSPPASPEKSATSFAVAGGASEKAAAPAPANPFAAPAATTSAFGSFGGAATTASTSKAPAFSFAAAAPSAAPTFSFGGASTSTPAASAAPAAAATPFTFGTPAAAPTPFGTASGAAKPFTFSFGSAVKPQSSSPPSSVGFSFGQSTAPTPAAPPPSQPVFSGASTPAPTDTEGEASDALGDADGGTNSLVAAGQGEEDETTIYEVRSKCFVVKDGKPTLLGICALKLNKSAEGRVRMLARHSTNGRITINFNLIKGMKVQVVPPATDKKPAEVVFVGLDEEGKLTNFRCQIKPLDEANAFKQAVEGAAPTS